MVRIYKWLVRFLLIEQGQDMVEYTMIIMVISIPIVLVAVGVDSVVGEWAVGLRDNIRSYL
ncbi:MAG: hypothetical protein HYS09_05175 [Chloroflexi bacterium]|nr:hypothetical protein [Chloroflexota bacterium]